MPRIPVAKCTILDILSHKESLNSQSETRVHGTKLKEDDKGMVHGQNFTSN